MRCALGLALVAAGGCAYRAGATAGGSDGAVDAPPLDASPFALHVQNQTAIGVGTTLTATLDRAVAVGDLLVGSFRGDAAGTITVADNVNGAWTKIDGMFHMNVFYRANSAAAPAGGLTLTLTETVSGNLRIVVDEFSDVAATGALDQYTFGFSGTGTAWAAMPSGSIAAGELVYVGGGTASQSVTFTAGATNGVAMVVGGQVANGTNGSSFTEYALSAAAGAQDATALATINTGITGIQALFRLR